MSILNVEHLSHGFGDRAIFQDVSFRLLKGEHIGLIGANGEGKSTFMNIITGHMQPDEGKVEWSKRVRVGYLDQHTVLEKGMTIREVLKSAFSFLFELEVQMNEICDHLGEASEDEMNVMMEELGTIQDLLMNHDFYSIDAKVEEVGRALGLTDIGLDRDVTDLSGGQRTKVLLGKLLLEKPDILLLDEPTNYLDVQHIEWLKRYLQEYENAYILNTHHVPYLKRVEISIIIWKISGLTAMWAITTSFSRCTRRRKRSSRQRISVSSRRSRSCRILWHVIKRVFPREIWRCPARKSWIKWM